MAATSGEDLQSWSLALETWVDCKPNGYILEEHRVAELLPTVAARIPGAAELFRRKQPGNPSVFEKLLRPRDGKVHYLCFWSAFSKAAQVAGANACDGLASEIETLRDGVLRLLDEKGPGLRGSEPHSGMMVEDADPTLPTWALVEEVLRAASMSVQPQFWQSAVGSMQGQMQQERLGLDELTSILLSWLHDSQLWEQRAASSSSSSAAPQRSDSNVSSASAFGLPAVSGTVSCLGRGPKPPKPDGAVGLQVLLHVYDVSEEESIQRINRILAHKHAPLKFGGIFHAGVEVNKLEWSYGYNASETRTGISCVEPKQHPMHHYRQTVVLRRTHVDPESIADIISDMLEEYPGDDYNLLRRNCCHFADDFCRRLGVGGIPGWIIRLARLGAGVETMLNAVPPRIKNRVIPAV
mmetsp:Transcript_105368/g.227151  ORF Transcript_105368/g.227151 Transcript_105368/m.227151 type:complete len:410 (-) Transcript_105368:76-1305(-)